MKSSIYLNRHVFVMMTNGTECFIIQLWLLSGIQLTRFFASISILPSNEIMLQQVREFIKASNEQLIKGWCVQSWNKAVRFGTPRCSQVELESVQKRTVIFVTLSSDLIQSKC